MNQKKIERVARAICFAAGAYHSGQRYCLICEKEHSNDCQMVEQFIDEALAAIKAMKGF